MLQETYKILRLTLALAQPKIKARNKKSYLIHTTFESKYEFLPKSIDDHNIGSQMNNILLEFLLFWGVLQNIFKTFPFYRYRYFRFLNACNLE